jgi:hypothetical protein
MSKHMKLISRNTDRVADTSKSKKMQKITVTEMFIKICKREHPQKFEM